MYLCRRQTLYRGTLCTIHFPRNMWRPLSRIRREEAPPDMEEKDYRRVDRERRRSSQAKGKDRRSSKTGKKEEAWTSTNINKQWTCEACRENQARAHRARPASAYEISLLSRITRVVVC